MNSIALTLLGEQLEGIAEEMGSALARAAFSPNIRVRRDFSCALFSSRGELLAQAAHIPVHLGSMPIQVRRLAETRLLEPGELYLGNDPFDGGTHLPDLTLLQPVFDNEGRPLGIVAARAHHADIGGTTPGSMSSQADIYGEGLRVPLLRVARDGVWEREILLLLLANMRAPGEREGDLLAQQAACRAGAEGLRRVVSGWAGGDLERWRLGQQALWDASASLTRAGLLRLLPPRRSAEWSDVLECDGVSLPIMVKVEMGDNGTLLADFQGTAPRVAASFNATLPVTQAALAYVVSCLLEEPISVNEGLLRCLEVRAPEGCLVNARYPAAVAAGNVETSQRIVDVLFGALSLLVPDRVPAASAGTMNNLSFGFSSGGVHYETAGGGSGAHPLASGASALQVHMTNTRSTPSEVLEQEFPVTVLSHRLRPGSGGAGLHEGGMGTVKVLRFEESASVTLMATRRTTAPYGLAGGSPGVSGAQASRRPDEDWEERPGSFTCVLPSGSEFRLETPGGGGWGVQSVGGE